MSLSMVVFACLVDVLSCFWALREWNARDAATSRVGHARQAVAMHRPDKATSLFWIFIEGTEWNLTYNTRASGNRISLTDIGGPLLMTIVNMRGAIFFKGPT